METIYFKRVKKIVAESLQIEDRSQQFSRETLLLGNIAELDSMAVANVIMALEENFDFNIEDDEISAELFESFGSLSDFVEKKLHP